MTTIIRWPNTDEHNNARHSYFVEVIAYGLFLIQGEAPADQDTLLDRAVRLDLPQAFSRLVLRGASRCMRLSETLTFAERHSSAAQPDERTYFTSLAVTNRLAFDLFPHM